MTRPKTSFANFLMFSLFAAYAVGRLISALPALNKPRSLADTTAYLRISQQPVLDVHFWGSTRPFIFPLLLKIANQNLRLTAALQLGISILVWSFLALMIARCMRGHKMQLFAFALILAFSLDRHITGWDFVMMTESLSISFLVLFIALSLWLLEGWQIGKVILFCVAGLILAFTRDTNAWLLLMLAGFWALAVLLHWTHPRALILVVFLTFTFFLSNANANLGGRWVFPLGNLIGKRVLPDPAAVRFFESCGMPISPALIQLQGKFSNAEDRAMYENPELAPFRSWLEHDGKSCYMRWLISDPIYRTVETFREFDGLIAFSDVAKYFSRLYDPLMPVAIGRFFYPDRFSLWIWGLTTLVALGAIWQKCWRDNPLWAVFVILVLFVPPHIFLTWHGDAMAPERHALSVGVQLYLSFWILILLLVDRYGSILLSSDWVATLLHARFLSLPPFAVFRRRRASCAVLPRAPAARRFLLHRFQPYFPEILHSARARTLR